jgi:hypothetical protein
MLETDDGFAVQAPSVRGRGSLEALVDGIWDILESQGGRHRDFQYATIKTPKPFYSKALAMSVESCRESATTRAEGSVQRPAALEDELRAFEPKLGSTGSSSSRLDCFVQSAGLVTCRESV